MSRFPRHLLIAGLFVQRELLEKPYSDNGWQYALCAGLSVSGIVLLGVLPNLALQLTTLIGVIVP